MLGILVILVFFNQSDVMSADPNYIPTNAEALGKMEVNCLIRVAFVRSGIKTSVYVWDSSGAVITTILNSS